MRIAQEIRHAVNGWRHGAAVDAFAAERTEVLAAWVELRARTRNEGDAVALSPAFRETLDRHRALMKRAETFRARPQMYERLLAERAGIGDSELEELREVHTRAGRYLRSVKASTAHAERQDVPHVQPAILKPIAAETAARAVESAPEERSQRHPFDPTAPPDPRHDLESTWEMLYDRLERDWNDTVAVANQARLPLPLVRGYDQLIARVRSLAQNPELPLADREQLTRLLDYHQMESDARRAVHDYLAAAERHVKASEFLQRKTEHLDVHIAEVAGWPEWRQEAQRLESVGKAMLADEETYGAYLDAVPAGKPRVGLAVNQLRDRIQDGHVDLAQAAGSSSGRRQDTKHDKGIAYILDDPEKLRDLREQRRNRERRIARQRKRRHGLSMYFIFDGWSLSMQPPTPCTRLSSFLAMCENAIDKIPYVGESESSHPIWKTRSPFLHWTRYGSRNTLSATQAWPSRRAQVLAVLRASMELPKNVQYKT